MCSWSGGYLAIEHEEPNEWRLSRTVRWEVGGEIPLPDPIRRNPETDSALFNEQALNNHFVKKFCNSFTYFDIIISKFKFLILILQSVYIMTSKNDSKL